MYKLECVNMVLTSDEVRRIINFVLDPPQDQHISNRWLCANGYPRYGEPSYRKGRFASLQRGARRLKRARPRAFWEDAYALDTDMSKLDRIERRWIHDAIKALVYWSTGTSRVAQHVHILLAVARGT